MVPGVGIEFPASWSFRRVSHLEMTNGPLRRQQLAPLSIQVRGPLKQAPVAQESLLQPCSFNPAAVGALWSMPVSTLTVRLGSGMHADRMMIAFYHSACCPAEKHPV